MLVVVATLRVLVQYECVCAFRSLSLSRIITAVNTFDVAVGGCWCC